jgi:hypothetical protein
MSTHVAPPSLLRSAKLLAPISITCSVLPCDTQYRLFEVPLARCTQFAPLSAVVYKSPPEPTTTTSVPSTLLTPLNCVLEAAATLTSVQSVKFSWVDLMTVPIAPTA